MTKTPIYENIIKLKPITKGWSSDQKYCATSKDGLKYLLRISSMEQYEIKKTEFEMMGCIATLGVPMCQPIEFGTCDKGVYSLQSWIEGSDAEEIIPILSYSEQYSYGLEAGRILKMIHSIPAPDTQENWGVYFNRKIDSKIQMYADCHVKYNNDKAFIEYIDANRHLLNNRPQVYQHGDYHRGNMMINKDGVLNIIDFNRNDFGDPWEDMKSITWDARTSPMFASGRINGYFNGVAPIEFWSLLALYICVGTISSIPWATAYGSDEINTMISLSDEVSSWYNNMQNPVPTWYREHEVE